MLHLDIEISPVLATVWGLFKQNIPITALVGNSEVLTWAAAWDGDDHVMYSGLHVSTKKQMIKEIHQLLEEADVVVTYNGDGFDLKILNMEFLLQGLPPPSPYESVDLLKVMRKNFRFTSNKLDYISKRLGHEGKSEHRGHQMWLDAMKGDKKALAEMSAYNCQDVEILEKLYHSLTPWIRKLNHSILTGELVCPHCGSKHFQSRGVRKYKSGMYQRYQCSAKGCRGWFRYYKAEPSNPRFMPL